MFPCLCAQGSSIAEYSLVAVKRRHLRACVPVRLARVHTPKLHLRGRGEGGGGGGGRGGGGKGRGKPPGFWCSPPTDTNPYSNRTIPGFAGESPLLFALASP